MVLIFMLKLYDERKYILTTYLYNEKKVLNKESVIFLKEDLKH